MLIDSHCHLDLPDFDTDRAETIARAKAAGLTRAVLIGLWRAPGDFGGALALRDADPDFFAATIGVHPHESVDVPEADFQAVETLSRDPRIAGIGETGLDYHYDHSPRPVQRAAFRRQVQIAKAANKPVVIHVREAHEDCAQILIDEQAAPGGIIHCFTGTADEARVYLDLGFFISISGVVTFKTAEALREAVKIVPLDRLLVETDSPFLAPVPLRGKRNEPSFVGHVAAKVAEVKGLAVDAVHAATTANALRAFGLSAG